MKARHTIHSAQWQACVIKVGSAGERNPVSDCSIRELFVEARRVVQVELERASSNSQSCSRRVESVAAEGGS
jgi:hypothetical protein